jgi:hypothetical protein
MIIEDLEKADISIDSFIPSRFRLSTLFGYKSKMMKGKPLVCIDCETDILKFGQNGGQEFTYGKTYYVIETYHIRFYVALVVYQ